MTCITDSMQTIDWVCVGILFIAGTWKLIDLINAAPVLAEKTMDWINKRF